ncbi:MAG: FAD-dependent oxidoreductase, partial [Muribaculaceae bacterium]|nr:FAD-dependent oxidoreductase [Muribaculaceae bacterium]
MSKEKKHLVIIGGGFAGLNLLRKIDKSKYRVTVIDRNNYHSFPPLFYQIASAGIDPAGISYP